MKKIIIIMMIILMIICFGVLVYFVVEDRKDKRGGPHELIDYYPELAESYYKSAIVKNRTNDIEGAKLDYDKLIKLSKVYTNYIEGVLKGKLNLTNKDDKDYYDLIKDSRTVEDPNTSWGWYAFLTTLLLLLSVGILNLVEGDKSKIICEWGMDIGFVVFLGVSSGFVIWKFSQLGDMKIEQVTLLLTFFLAIPAFYYLKKYMKE